MERWKYCLFGSPGGRVSVVFGEGRVGEGRGWGKGGGLFDFGGGGVRGDVEGFVVVGVRVAVGGARVEG